MGLVMINALINKHLPKAFDGALKDAVKPFTASRQGTSQVYDPVEDEYVGATSVTYTGRGVFGSYSTLERQDTQIDITDTKLTCVQIEVTSQPEIDDIITMQGQELRVLNIDQDPTSSIWIMQLRGVYVGQET